MTQTTTNLDLEATLPHVPAVAAGGVPRPLNVRSHGRTDPGRVRQNNEDQFLVAVISRALQILQTSLSQPSVQYSSPQGRLFLVADGVGGHAGGEKASSLAVQAVEDFIVDALCWCMQLKSPSGEALLGEFQKALTHAEDRVVDLARRRPELRGMATTVTMGYVFGRDLFVAHAGDSRCYLLRDNVFYRLTRDHTLTAELVKRGVVKPEEAAKHAFRHVVVNVVGGSDAVRVDVHKMPLDAGDVLLLCSDGLTEMVPEAEIFDLIKSNNDPKSACDRLIDRANEKGGKDNITVIVARCEE
jgi:serine/threonine protein phosphatase PrpC